MTLKMVQMRKKKQKIFLKKPYKMDTPITTAQGER